MMNDDDPLAAYDLSAWDVPPPAPGLADAVIARARQPAPVAALDSEPLAPSPRSTRRRWIAAVGAAVAIAAIVVGVWGIQRAPEDGDGEVNATTAQALALGSTTAALDPGARVRWRRDKRRISVAQPRGTALWNVAAEDTLVIDAGAMVATVEASGASLRVEVKMMNASDARAVGISAATAVAVALVTIVVYEGTVRVRHDGQTVNVVPGAQYEVRPPAPTLTPAPEPVAVSGGPVDPRIRELEDRIKQLEAERDALDPSSPAKATCDEVSCVLNNYDGACCARFKRPRPSGLPDGLDRKMISDAMRAVKVKILDCPTEGFTGTVKVKAVVAGNGIVSAVASATPPMTVPAALAACITDLVHSAKFPATVNGGSFGYPFVFEAAATAAACDADALMKNGDDHIGSGRDAAALAAYEASMRCRPDSGMDTKAYMAACRSNNAPKAKLYFAKLPEERQSSLAQVCTRMGIDVRAASCDAAALAQKGDEHLGTGMDGQALVAFEESLACKPDRAVTRKAFLAACRSKNLAKARKYFPAVPSSLNQYCVRNGISVDELQPVGGVIKVASTPPAKLFLDGVDTGKTTPATLQAKAGKHKVTFDIGGDKYTFPVTVEEGENVTLSKDFQ